MVGLTELVQVTHGVLFPLLGQVDDLSDERVVQKSMLRGSVAISGTTRAWVIVDCSELLARRLTAAMFDASEDELRQEDVDDAIGEIANIIGGNLKAMLPGPSQLSLPSIQHSVEARPKAPVLEQVFDCSGEALRVCLTSDTSG